MHAQPLWLPRFQIILQKSDNSEKGTVYAKVAFLSHWIFCDSVNAGGIFAVYKILDGCTIRYSDSVRCASERKLPSLPGVAFEPREILSDFFGDPDPRRGRSDV